MADSYDRHRRRRRRERTEYGRQSDDASPTPPSKPVTILGLAKPSKTSSTPQSNEYGNSRAADLETTDIVYNESSDSREGDNRKPSLLKTAENRSSIETRSKPEDSAPSVDENTGAAAGLIKKSSVPSAVANISGVIDQGAQIHSKLVAPIERQASYKLIDENSMWCEIGFDLMLDQTDFLVVGIVGLQGSGKSTLLSLLAGNNQQDAYRNYIFFPQTKEAKEDCGFQTLGIDMFVTSERIILLDTQPLLSAAMMDSLLRHDKKFPSEYTSLQNYVEMQSLQILTFLMSVCNVILVADDWFIDMDLLRIIQDAEMLKPSTHPPSSSGDSSSSREDLFDLYPTVIFVHNKASRDDFTPETYTSMQQVLHRMFAASKLKLHGNINMTNNSVSDPVIQELPQAEKNEASDLNLLLIPVMEFYKLEPESLHSTLPDYRGYPSFSTILSFFRSQIVSAPRSPVTHNTLTEKNWYHFAARSWEAVKKSPLLAEYNRLLSATS